MFRKLCKSLGHISNAMTTGCSNFKTSTLTRHMTSSDHKLALLAPTESVNMLATVDKIHGKEGNQI